jgi:hypothetical protein
VPAFAPPRLSELRAVLRRSLRDSGPTAVFSDELLDDWVKEALADLSIFRPAEVNKTIPFDPLLTSTGGVDLADYDEYTYMWQVDARTNSAIVPYGFLIPYIDPGAGLFRNGWDFALGRLWLSTYWFNRLSEVAAQYPDDGVSLGIYGYRDRNWPTADNSYLDLLDATDHLCVVRHVRMLGFTTLEADRGLYQQWLAATNNTDMSPTQLQGMRNQAEQSYERLRKQVSRPKRVPVSGIQYQS